MSIKIGDKIYQRRTELNMSQEELALKVGYKDRSSIARIESGERDLRQKQVPVFAQALKTTAAWLIGCEEVEKETPLEPLALKASKSEWIYILERLSDENLIKLRDYAQLLLMSQDQDDQGDQESPK